jgi:hypothetical protein
MAATRAAELTGAYKTLADQALRQAYDASLDAGQPEQSPPTEPAETEPLAPSAEETTRDAPPVMGKTARFAAERAGRDLILKRAIFGRVRAAAESLYGVLDAPVVRGFDLSLVPLATAVSRVAAAARPGQAD